jgi:hypothetical protein
MGSAKDQLVFQTLTLPLTFGLFLGAALDLAREELKVRGVVFKFPRKILFAFLLWLISYYVLAILAINQQSPSFQFYLIITGTPIGVVILGIPLYQMEKLGAFRKTTKENKQ